MFRSTLLAAIFEFRLLSQNLELYKLDDWCLIQCPHWKFTSSSLIFFQLQSINSLHQNSSKVYFSNIWSISPRHDLAAMEHHPAANRQGGVHGRRTSRSWSKKRSIQDGQWRQTEFWPTLLRTTHTRVFECTSNRWWTTTTRPWRGPIHSTLRGLWRRSGTISGQTWSQQENSPQPHSVHTSHTEHRRVTHLHCPQKEHASIQVCPQRYHWLG